MSTLEMILVRCKYKYRDQTKKDISNVFSFYHGLQPKMEKFTFPDGKEQELVVLDGTIPISFKGAIYHIPVGIFVQKDHPYSPPMCYVRPTPEMAIKASKYVSNDGRIFLPYLSDWKADSSDILGVIQVMIIIFGETPPVYQKPKTSPMEQQYKPPPPYPQQTYSQLPGPPTTVNLPPVSTSVASPSYSNSNPPYPNSSYPYSSFPSSEPPFPHTNPQYPNYPNYPPSTGYNAQASVTIQSSTPSSNSRTITEEHIRASLITAVNDKIKEKLRERLGRGYAENDVLYKYADDLGRGRDKLNGLLKRMEQDKSELENCKKMLNTKITQIDELISKLENEQKINAIDDAFGPQEPLYKQLLNAFAEENATVDAIYYLGEARRKGVIDLDAFLKNVRELSRRQFMLRALMQKCREKAGLPF